jgi:hypothetical protein
MEKLGLLDTVVGWRAWLGIFFTVALELVAIWLSLRRFGAAIRRDNNLILAGATLLLLFTLLGRLCLLLPSLPISCP